mgnify:CR=1 FL=1
MSINNIQSFGTNSVSNNKTGIKEEQNQTSVKENSIMASFIDYKEKTEAELETETLNIDNSSIIDGFVKYKEATESEPAYLGAICLALDTMEFFLEATKEPENPNENTITNDFIRYKTETADETKEQAETTEDLSLANQVKATVAQTLANTFVDSFFEGDSASKEKEALSLEYERIQQDLESGELKLN